MATVKKFKVTFSTSSSGTPRNVGTFDSMHEAAEGAWKYAHDNGMIRSSCETHASVVEAMENRGYCMLGYGPDELEVEEVEVAVTA